MLTIEAQIVQSNSEKELAWNVQNCAIELNKASDTYFLYQENSQLEAWKKNFYSLSNNLTELNSPNPRQQTIIASIENNLQQLNTTFTSIVLLLQNAPRNQSIRTLPEFQTSWSQQSDENSQLIFNSAQLTQAIDTRSDQLQLYDMWLIVVLVGLFGAYFLVNYFILFRRTLRSISSLQAGIAVIGSGNLDYHIKKEKDDEIGQLSDSFNQMTANLKSMTASKAVLEEEIARRKKAELQLEKYSKDLEKIVEERTYQLREKERMAAIGATAGMVGHDLRNPLQSIIGEVFLAKAEIEELPDSEQKVNLQENIEVITEQADYMNKIVSDLQTFVKPVEPQTQIVKLKPLIATLLAQVNIPADIQTTMQVPNELTVKADPQLLKRVLINLLTNALQAMPQGGELTIEVQTSKNRQVQIAVKDTGVGIPEEIKPKIFTPLFTTKPKGQGFGLAVCKRVIEAQGGKIYFESQQGKGTTFTISLSA